MIEDIILFLPRLAQYLANLYPPYTNYTIGLLLLVGCIFFILYFLRTLINTLLSIIYKAIKEFWIFYKKNLIQGTIAIVTTLSFLLAAYSFQSSRPQVEIEYRCEFNGANQIISTTTGATKNTAGYVTLATRCYVKNFGDKTTIIEDTSNILLDSRNYKNGYSLYSISQADAPSATLELPYVLEGNSMISYDTNTLVPIILNEQDQDTIKLYEDKKDIEMSIKEITGKWLPNYLYENISVCDDGFFGGCQDINGVAQRITLYNGDEYIYNLNVKNQTTASTINEDVAILAESTRNTNDVDYFYKNYFSKLFLLRTNETTSTNTTFVGIIIENILIITSVLGYYALIRRGIQHRRNRTEVDTIREKK